MKENNEMKIPEGWKLVPVEPTEEMCRAAEESEHGSSAERWIDGGYTPENVEGIYKTMLEAAPTSQAQTIPLETLVAEMESDPEMKAALDEARGKFISNQEPLGKAFEDVLYKNLDQLYESEPAQEDEPVAWLIGFACRGEQMRTVAMHNAIADYRDIDPNATSTPLYTRPDNGELRLAAEALRRYLDEAKPCCKIPAFLMQNLRNALKEKS